MVGRIPQSIASSKEADRRRQWLGIPDWQQDTCYPDVRTARGWAWEFLRRNAEYRNDFALLLDAQKKWGSSMYALHHAPNLDLWFCQPPAIAGEAYADWKRRVRGNSWRRTPLYRYLARKYGLRASGGLPNFSVPSTATTCPAFFEAANAGFQYEEYIGLEPIEVLWRLERLGDVAIFFDARENVRRHLRRAKELLETIQEKCKAFACVDVHEQDGRRTSDSLRTYLRILDACENPMADHISIAEVLYPKDSKGTKYPTPKRGRRTYPNAPRERRYEAAHSEAIYLRDNGWLELARQSSLDQRKSK